MLGPPDGSSPACNRAVTSNGKFDSLLPPGQFYVYATRGPFAALDRRQIRVEAGNQVSLTMVVPIYPMLPDGAVSGDFHVHGAASYDSSIGDKDRVLSFLAAGVDVVIPTDHDVVTSYANVLASMPVGTNTLVVIPGVEQTPNIIWFDVRARISRGPSATSIFGRSARISACPKTAVPGTSCASPGR